MLAPKATPKDVVEKLSREIAKAVQSQDVNDKLAALGNESVGSTTAEAEKYIAEEADRWAKVLKAAGIRAD